MVATDFTNYLQNLIPCAISNQKFYIQSLEKPTGAKLIIDELPNAGRIIQFFGEKENIFTISGAIESYKYLKFEEALFIDLKSQIVYLDCFQYLNEPIILQDILPKDSSSHIGITYFTITALQSKITTDLKANTKNQNLREAKIKLNLTAIQKMQNFYRATTNLISTAKAQIASVSQVMKAVTESIQSIQTNLEQFKESIDSLIINAGALVRAPFNLANALNDIVASFSNTAQLFEEQVQAISAVISGIKPSIVSNSSQYLREQEQLDNILKSTLTSYLITNYMGIVENTDFNYDYAVQKEINRLQDFIVNIENVNDKELKTNLTNAIYTTIDFLKRRLLEVQKPKQIVIGYKTSLALLCSTIYGTLDNQELLRLWNFETLQNTNFIEPNTTILYYE